MPNDVNNLFDISLATKTTVATATSAATQIDRTTSLAVPDTAAVTSIASKGALKTSPDKEGFTATQNKLSTSEVATETTFATPTTLSEAPATAGTPAQLPTVGVTTYSKDDQILHPLHDEADLRCRYCSMQFLKVIDLRKKCC